MIIVICHRCLS